MLDIIMDEQLLRETRWPYLGPRNWVCDNIINI